VVDLLKQAAEEENMKNYEKALGLYKEGLKFFFEFTRSNRIIF
jgi:hypothetical protein